MKEIEGEYKKIGRQIRFIRMRKGVTQGELAKRLGVAQAALSSIELAKTRTTLRRLFQIRDALDCEMRDFFDYDSQEQVRVEEILEALQIMKKIKLAEAREN